MTAKQWSLDEIAHVVSRCDAGETSSRVARDYGVTRNAIIGIYHRARVARGDKAAPVPKTKPRTLETAKRMKPTMARKAVVILKPLPSREEALARAAGITAVTGCRWEITGSMTVADYRFCNAPQCNGSSYCEQHKAESIKTTKAALRAYKPQRAA